jgi:hypothetical protein
MHPTTTGMSPDAIYTLFIDAAARFTPITGNPTYDDLTTIREVLTPLLLSISYGEVGTHNLVGIIDHPATYLATWLTPFPIPAQPTSYETAIANDATPVMRTSMEAIHAILLQDFASHEAAEWGTVKFLHDTIDKLWYKNLKIPPTA